MQHNHHPFLYFLYAVVLLAGGIYGYVRAQSMPSLYGGIGAAVLAILGALIMHKHPRAGLFLEGIVSEALGIFFILRYVKTKSAMPAIPMIVISEGVFFITVWWLIHALKAAHPG